MIKVKHNYEKVRSRIRRLPKYIDLSADAVVKKDGIGLIDSFKDGIRKNNFGLKSLKPDTIARKIRKGYTRPQAPLYGKGDHGKNTYINALGLRRIKRGWRVYVRWAKHHESDLTLRDLFYVHENGMLIEQNRGGYIRIPPRPAFYLAYRRWLRRRSRNEDIKTVRKAIRQLLRTGNDRGFGKLLKELRRNHENENLD